VEAIHKNAEAINKELRKEEEMKGKTPYTTSQIRRQQQFQSSSSSSSSYNTQSRRYASTSSVLNSESSSSSLNKLSFSERREALRKFQNKSLDKGSPLKV
jgi:hypothetical protein